MLKHSPPAIGGPVIAESFSHIASDSGSPPKAKRVRRQRRDSTFPQIHHSAQRAPQKRVGRAELGGQVVFRGFVGTQLFPGADQVGLIRCQGMTPEESLKVRVGPRELND